MILDTKFNSDISLLSLSFTVKFPTFHSVFSKISKEKSFSEYSSYKQTHFPHLSNALEIVFLIILLRAKEKWHSVPREYTWILHELTHKWISHLRGRIWPGHNKEYTSETLEGEKWMPSNKECRKTKLCAIKAENSLSMRPKFKWQATHFLT